MSEESKRLCRLCREEKKLIKAHVTPEGFYRLLRSDNLAPEMHSNTPGTYPKRMQIGLYDPAILCADCDQKMAPWDAYVQEVLIQRFSEAQPILLRERVVARKMENVDYRKLKLFFISLLWRASISSLPFYKRISCGPFEDELRAMILSADPGRSQDFAVILARIEEPEVTAMLDPHRERFDSISFCRFYLSGFTAHIKVDQRPAPQFLAAHRIQENAPLTILVRTLHNSPDGRVMRELAEGALAWQEKKNKAAPR